MPVLSNSIVDANQGIIKTWKLKNDGNEALPAGLLIKYSGRKNNPMVSCQVFEVGNKKPIKSGEEFEVQVCVKTPEMYGRYSSNWRLTTPNGRRFGQKLPFYLVLKPQNDNQNDNQMVLRK